MVTILQVLLMFFGATTVCDYVLTRFGVKSPLSLGLATLFGVLCAIFLSTVLALIK